MTFNKTFHITPIKDTPLLVNEINNLSSENILWQRNASKGSSLHLSDLVQGTTCKDGDKGRYPMLSSIFQVAHSLPTSSAWIEQSFSYLKLFKNQQRNCLSEQSLHSLRLLKEYLTTGEDIVSERLIEMYIEMKESIK